MNDGNNFRYQVKAAFTWIRFYVYRAAQHLCISVSIFFYFSKKTKLNERIYFQHLDFLDFHTDFDGEVRNRVRNYNYAWEIKNYLVSRTRRQY